jgi:hypothetical protein
MREVSIRSNYGYMPDLCGLGKSDANAVARVSAQSWS